MGGLGLTALPAAVNLLLLAFTRFVVRISLLAEILTFAFVVVTPLFELAATLVVLGRTSSYSSRVRWWAFLGWTLLLNAVVYLVGGIVVVSFVLSSLADV